MAVQAAKLEWHGEIADERAHAGGVRGLQVAMEHLLGVSREVTPREEGTLRRSGVASVDATRLEGAVSYDTPYAVRQHEELTWHHTEGMAKFLEIPAHEESDVMLGLVAAQIRRALR